MFNCSKLKIRNFENVSKAAKNVRKKGFENEIKEAVKKRKFVCLMEAGNVRQSPEKRSKGALNNVQKRP